jgi:hypothetical protein
MSDKLYMTLAEMLEHSNTRAGNLYKWARVNGDFRFIHYIYGEQHTMLVDEGEEATSAGNITMNDDFWRMPSRGSMTLNVGCSSEDEIALEETLAAAGREFKPPYQLTWD